MSGAAVPEELVQEVVDRLGELSERAGNSVELQSMPAVDEGMVFQIPSSLRTKSA